MTGFENKTPNFTSVLQQTVAATVREYPLCELSNVVAFSYNELWQLKVFKHLQISEMAYS